MPDSRLNRNQDAVPSVLLLSLGSEAASGRIANHLGDSGIAVSQVRPQSEAEFLQIVMEVDPDVILAEADFDPLPPSHALHVLHAAGMSTPLIILLDPFDAASAVQSLRAGAVNLVFRSSLDRLLPAIKEAISARKPLNRLSPRQREVLRLVAQGHSTRAIAEELGLSVKTVETHRSEIIKRLGIRDVAGLVRYAISVGLTPLELDQERVA